MIPKSRFTHAIIHLNQMTGVFGGWLFHNGMGFGKTAAWWKQGERKTPHEGIDLLFYVDQLGQTRQLAEEAMIPATWQGMVVAEFKDFLGSTVVVKHDITDGQGWLLHTLYGHTRPLVELGMEVATGQAIAKIAATGSSRRNTPPGHLHLSLAWLHPKCTPASLDWPTLTRCPMVRLIDPMPITDILHNISNNRH